MKFFQGLMVMLMEPEFCAALRSAKTADEFLSVIDKKETEKYPDEPKAEVAKKDGYRILAVTACPTVLVIPIWLPRHSKKRAKKWAIRLRLKLTVQAAQRIF